MIRSMALIISFRYVGGGSALLACPCSCVIVASFAVAASSTGLPCARFRSDEGETETETEAGAEASRESLDVREVRVSDRRFRTTRADLTAVSSRARGVARRKPRTDVGAPTHVDTDDLDRSESVSISTQSERSSMRLLLEAAPMLPTLSARSMDDMDGFCPGPDPPCAEVRDSAVSRPSSLIFVVVQVAVADVVVAAVEALALPSPLARPITGGSMVCVISMMHSRALSAPAPLKAATLGQSCRSLNIFRMVSRLSDSARRIDCW